MLIVIIKLTFLLLASRVSGSLRNVSSIPDPIPSGECEELQNDFIAGYNSMSTCFIRYAPTGDYCLQCKSNLQFLRRTYHDLRNTHQHPSNQSCFDVLCRQNNIGIVCSDYKYIGHIWEESKCNYCYVNNSISSDILKPDVEVYTSLVKNVTDCFEEVDDVCVQCQDAYRQFSKMFFHEWYAWSQTGSYQCRDIYDKYNVTMRQWSEVYGCVRESGESFLLPYILLFIYIVVLYFSFYFTVIYILPNQKFLQLSPLKSRTEVLPIDITIRELRSKDLRCSQLSLSEVEKEASCPCFSKLTKFVQEYRDAREDFRRESPPDPRVIASIHQKYAQTIHNSRNFQM